jgi:hypothetical protein
LEACLRAEQDRWGEAGRLLEEGLEFDLENGLPQETQFAKHHAMALVYLHEGKASESVATCRRILDKKPGRRAVLDAGALLARAGDVAGARACIPEGLPKVPPAEIPTVLPAGVPKELQEWPLYWRRLLLLWGEIALQDGDAKRAFGLLQSAPPGEAAREWPQALVRASILSGEHATAERSLRALLANPAAYWLVADVSGPGFMRDALPAVTFVDSSGSLASWKRFLR